MIKASFRKCNRDLLIHSTICLIGSFRRKVSFLCLFGLGTRYKAKRRIISPDVSVSMPLKIPCNPLSLLHFTCDQILAVGSIDSSSYFDYGKGRNPVRRPLFVVVFLVSAPSFFGYCMLPLTARSCYRSPIYIPLATTHSCFLLHTRTCLVSIVVRPHLPGTAF